MILFLPTSNLQSVDTLEHLSGLNEDKIVEAHGSFSKARCINCKTPVSREWLKKKVKGGHVARCEKSKCQYETTLAPPIKPDITFFGESLPERFFERLYDLRRANLLLVMGTSLVVQPFASLIDEVPLDCPRALLNLERVGETGRGSMFSKFGLDFSEGFDFDSEDSRDIFCPGAVDKTVRLIAQKCGWEVRVSKKKNAITGFTSMIERIGRNAPTDAPKIRPHTWPDGAT